MAWGGGEGRDSLRPASRRWKCRPDLWNLEGHRITALLRTTNKENPTECIISGSISGCPLFLEENKFWHLHSRARAEVGCWPFNWKGKVWKMGINRSKGEVCMKLSEWPEYEDSCERPCKAQESSTSPLLLTWILSLGSPKSTLRFNIHQKNRQNSQKALYSQIQFITAKLYILLPSRSRSHQA